ncbi:MAG: ribosomal protein S18-alanine N-acetyltransferase [Proteobacteria bacterium]|nr:ribosomal protein S18-alanine N-acetyltransferase [Pseudomonadota bacterium]
MRTIVFFNHENAPLEDLAKIHTSSFLDSWDQDTFDAFLTSFGTAGLYLAENDHIVGFILYRQAFSDAEILTFCVLPDLQNKGVGGGLIEAMLLKLTKPGKCFLEVSDKNESAVYLYKKFGFEIVHTRQNYYGEGLDAYMMMKEV